MTQVNIYEAKSQLSRLVARAAAGEEIVIARAGKPMARLVPLDEGGETARVPGRLKGLIEISDEWDSEETNAAIAALFESGPLEPCGE